MKRVVIFGAIGAVVVGILLVALVLGIMVTPARAQIGQALNQAVSGVQAIAARAQQTQGIQLKAEKGVLVAGVIQDSPADKAGLVRGDIILSIDGTEVNKDNDLRNALSSHKAGDSLKLTVQHGDSQKTVTVTLAEPPVATPAATPQNGQQNNNQNQRKGGLLFSPYLGIVPIGAGQFSIKESLPGNNGRPGARITQVASGSPAENAGLKAGDLILSVDGTQVGPQNSLSALIAKHKPGDSVKLTVKSMDGSQRDVTVTLGSSPQNSGTAYLGVTTNGFGRGHGFGFPDFGMPGPGFRGNPNLAQHPGAYIQSVTQNSPAAQAGLKAGQVIESVDGKKLDTAQALPDAISAHKPGDKVTLSVYDPQTNQTSRVQLTLGDNPQKAGSAWMGIEYSYFNVPPQQPTPGTSGTNF